MPDVRFSQLIPVPEEVDADTLAARIEPETLAPADRPYTLANFVATADGSATFQGRSGGIGDDGDRAMFHALREQVDAVLAGTATLGTEGYGRILGRPERRERRLAAGRTAEPLACVITRSGRLPLEIPLFAEPEAHVLVFSPEAIDLADVPAQVRLERYDPDAERPLAGIMSRLRRGHGVRSLLCEGGPAMFSSLLHEGLVDELFLTVAPKLAGGSTDPSITAGDPLPAPAQMRIAWLLERKDALFLRYRLTAASGA